MKSVRGRINGFCTPSFSRKRSHHPNFFNICQCGTSKKIWIRSHLCYKSSWQGFKSPPGKLLYSVPCLLCPIREATLNWIVRLIFCNPKLLNGPQLIQPLNSKIASEITGTWCQVVWIGICICICYQALEFVFEFAICSISCNKYTIPNAKDTKYANRINR